MSQFGNGNNRTSRNLIPSLLLCSGGKKGGKKRKGKRDTGFPWFLFSILDLSHRLPFLSFSSSSLQPSNFPSPPHPFNHSTPLSLWVRGRAIFSFPRFSSLGSILPYLLLFIFQLSEKKTKKTEFFRSFDYTIPSNSVHASTQILANPRAQPPAITSSLSRPRSPKKLPVRTCPPLMRPSDSLSLSIAPAVALP